MACLYKQLQLDYTRLSWCQPSISLYFPNIPLSLSQIDWGRTNMLSPFSPSAINIQISPCHSTVIVLHFIFSVCFSVCVYILHLCWVMKVQQCRNVNWFRTCPSLGHLLCTDPKCLNVRSTAAMQKHDPLVFPTVSTTRFCGFSCISAAACWGSTPCAHVDHWDSQMPAGSLVWRF